MPNQLIRYKDTTPLKKHMGNQVLVAHDGRIYGYEILTYDKYEPDTLRLVNSIENPAYKVMSWDTAFDMIFGAPTQKPDFTKVIR